MKNKLILLPLLCTNQLFANLNEVTLLKTPTGATFKKARTLTIPENQVITLSEDVHMKLDRLEINGTLFTEGHLFHAYIGKLIFGPKGVIKTFQSSARSSTIKLERPPTPPVQGDQPQECAEGFTGLTGTNGYNAPADPLTDGLANPQPIIIFAAELEGPINIEAFGQNGGKGAKGGPGGQGGQGGRGGKADADGGPFSFTSHTCPGGRGGLGGQGGSGGQGGVGGHGGPAPKVEIYLSNILLKNQDFSTQITRVQGKGGEGGDTGDVGPGGIGGEGGGDDASVPIVNSLPGKSHQEKGDFGPTGPAGFSITKIGKVGENGDVPKLQDRLVEKFTNLENKRAKLFSLWQEFHWRRYLLAHVEDSLRLSLSQRRTRAQLLKNLNDSKTPSYLEEAKENYVKRIIQAWEIGFIEPLNKAAQENLVDGHIQEGLDTAKEVVSLLQLILNKADLESIFKKIESSIFLIFSIWAGFYNLHGIIYYIHLF
jgi:hypothetical protein